jgi:hypothetical protein
MIANAQLIQGWFDRPRLETAGSHQFRFHVIQITL